MLTPMSSVVALDAHGVVDLGTREGLHVDVVLGEAHADQVTLHDLGLRQVGSSAYERYPTLMSLPEMFPASVRALAMFGLFSGYGCELLQPGTPGLKMWLHG